MTPAFKNIACVAKMAGWRGANQYGIHGFIFEQSPVVVITTRHFILTGDSCQCCRIDISECDNFNTLHFLQVRQVAYLCDTPAANYPQSQPCGLFHYLSQPVFESKANPPYCNLYLRQDTSIALQPTNPILRIGTLGAARITPAALVEPARELDGVDVAAVAARDPGRARAFARKHGIGRVFDCYQQLLEDPSIDAIYVPLPNGLHCEWTIRALEAGKHVLCEKPFSSNAAEARRMVDASRRAGLVLMEASHYRHHPLMARVRERVPELGTLRRIDCRMCIPLPRFTDIRYNYSLAGGSNMDLGAYTIDMLRQVATASGDKALNSKPRVKWARAQLVGPDADRAMEAELAWENQCRGHIVNSLWSWRIPGVSLSVMGERGQLKVANPVFPHPRHRIQLKIDGKTRFERVPGKTTYYYQLQEFEHRIRQESASDDLEESIATMELIDDIYLAAGLPLR